MDKISQDLKVIQPFKGVFLDSAVQGLEYQTRTYCGITNEKGEFKYLNGETVTFSVGGLVLGTAPGNQRVTPADLVIEASGSIHKIKNKKVTNIARFLQSLDKSGNIERGIVISDETKEIIKRYRYQINFEQKEGTFTGDPAVKSLFAELKLPLLGGTQARNHLRRTLNNIVKITNIRIPTRDGSYLLADIYYPLNEGKYPAIVALGGHGKVILKTLEMKYSSNNEDLAMFEEVEDEYFEGNPRHLPSVENHGAANTVDWVPEGYALVKIDERGVGDTPGLHEQFSLQEAKDYYDAIEWTAKQPWCNGKVGAWGFSYWANTQWNMAQLQPPSLKAMMPVMGQIDSYRDYTYNGGLYSHVAHVVKNSSGEWKGIDWPAVAKAHPFYEPGIYGPEGMAVISPDLSKIEVPLWSVMPLEYFNINIRGSSEGYIHSASKNKKITIVGDYWGAYPYSPEFTKASIDFFDYWLKGIPNGIMNQPPVRMTVRLGGGGYYWQDENEWPIARTVYTRYYLEAAHSSFKGDDHRNHFLKISKTVPAEESSGTYSAEVNVGKNPGWAHGISFITEPMSENLVLAGYLKLGLWISSTSTDMDIVASIRIMDEDGSEIPYSMTYSYGGIHYPVTIGWLKVSHRKTDPEKSTNYRPWLTHLKADYQPLKPGEIVPVEVEIWPTTALIQKGRRLRLDVQPTDGLGHPATHEYDESYHKGARNTIYTGPEHPSYLQLPVIP
jgi:uncharacterized protein